jgi:hypothetical protein
MKTDNLTKILLAVIAIALWLIAANPWLQPMPVSAQEKTDLSTVEASLSSIDNHFSSMENNISSMESDLSRLSRGTCTNGKVC